MSAPDAGGGWRQLFMSLASELAPSGALVARLVVEEPDERMVEIELTGDELAGLLAGETLSVRGRVGGRPARSGARCPVGNQRRGA